MKIFKTRDRETIKWMSSVSRKMRIPVILLTILTAIQASFGVFFALLSKDFINSAVYHDYDGIIRYLIYIVTFTSVFLLMKVGIIFFQEYTVARLEIIFRTRMFKEILAKDYGTITTYHSGDLLNRLTSDVQIVANGCATIIPSVGALLTKFIVALAVIVSIDYKFALIFIVGGILLFIFSRLIKSRTKKLHKQNQETEGKTRSFIQEAIENMLVIKVFSNEEKIAEKAAELQEDNYKVKVKRRRLGIFTNTSLNSVMQFSYLYALAWGVFGIYSGTIDYGTLTALTQLVGQVQTPFTGASSILSKWFALSASAERLIDICNIQNENIERLHMSKKSAEKLYSNLESINFENINFSYDRNTVLEDASLKIDKGDFVAIMGISGIGKSTLLKLLLGIYKSDAGDIYFKLNDATKVKADYKTRALFSFVPQGNMLLSGTIRENVAFLRDNISDEEILEALRISCADEFLSEFPNGIDTVIGEKGIGLSEGQIQRIAIARAIVTNAPVILLDEATSALDEATEEKFLNNLKSLNRVTCIIISHKKAALKICNKHIAIVEKAIADLTDVDM